MAIKDLKVYVELKTGNDGNVYPVRYVMLAEDVKPMQALGLIGPRVVENVTEQEAAAIMQAVAERGEILANGGLIQ